jgi:L-ascorbate metabolism protein UlaG (beta-lactamase superfamily)
VKLRYLGHSCFQLQVNGKLLVFDPFIRGNTLAADAGIDIDAIEADYILVSHGHDDHTGDLMYMAERTSATVIASWEIYSWLNKQGYTQAHPMNVGGSREFEFGKLKMTFAAHSSSLADGTYAGVAAGYILQTESKCLYYAGDTALTQDMKLIGEYYKPDWAILPLGDNFTMGYEDANRAADMIGCNKIIGMHYDTFGLIQLDHKKAVSHFKQNQKELHLLPIGTEIAL